MTMMTNKVKKEWLDSLSTRDLIYLKMMTMGQVEPDENDAIQQRIRKSYERARMAENGGESK